jgi:hypothetical protein
MLDGLEEIVARQRLTGTMESDCTGARNIGRKMCQKSLRM